MTPLPLSIAFAHLLARKRQTVVSIVGVMLGVAVFIGGMMNGFHHYFLSQLIDTNPHIVISDEVRQAAPQPLIALHPDAAVEVRRVLPRDPVRSISGVAAILEALNAMDGVAAAPSLIGQAILRHAGRDYSVTAIGVDPEREMRVTDLVHDMVEGSSRRSFRTRTAS
jgi:lipoprotein-releasing system permease protein